MVKRRWCAYCGKEFETLKEKTEHKKKFPDGTCKNKLDLEEMKGGNEEMFGRKKKSQSVAPPSDDIVLSSEEKENDELKKLKAEINRLETETESLKQKTDEEEVEEEAEEESYQENEIQDNEIQNTEPTKLPELTEEEATKILIAHDDAIRKIMYHLRLM